MRPTRRKYSDGVLGGEGLKKSRPRLGLSPGEAHGDSRVLLGDLPGRQGGGGGYRGERYVVAHMGSVLKDSV